MSDRLWSPHVIWTGGGGIKAIKEPEAKYSLHLLQDLESAELYLLDP